jgi:hypothetical protein
MTLALPQVYESLKCHTERPHCQMCRGSSQADKNWRRFLVELTGGPIDYDCVLDPPVPWSDGYTPSDEVLPTPQPRAARVVRSAGRGAKSPAPPPKRTAADYAAKQERATKNQRSRQFSQMLNAAYHALGGEGSCISCGDSESAELHRLWVETTLNPVAFFVAHGERVAAFLSRKRGAAVLPPDGSPWARAMLDAAEQFKPPEPIGPGPGRLLSKMIYDLTGHITEECPRCHERALQMNAWGYSGCVLHARTIYGWLRQECDERKITVDRKLIWKAIKAGLRTAKDGSAR